jgi:hypothetical protein
MPKGNPNNKSKLLNFVAKVYDPIAKTYKPIYEAPDATSEVYGDVLLSDKVDETLDAATGVTAATPKALSDLDKRKLDLKSSKDQTVSGPVHFNGRATFGQELVGNLIGSVRGVADSARRLENPKSISVKGGTNAVAGIATFDGEHDVTITLPQIDATAVTGVLPLSAIPKSAVENMITVVNREQRLKLTKEKAQNGDTVFQSDAKVMYLVVNENKLNTEDGYQEYRAGTAAKLGTTTIGGEDRPIYLKDGEPTPFTGTLGAGNRPAYIKNGIITACDFTVDKSVPADAKFTDSFAPAMKGATTVKDGEAGIVPQPRIAERLKFLRGDGTWQVAGEVTGVKGDKENSYRVGQVNITPSDIGAIGISGGTLEGTLNTTTVLPTVDNGWELGSAAKKYKNIYATTFKGNLTGVATQATLAEKLNKTISVIGSASGTVSLNTTQTNVALNINLQNNSVTTNHITNKAVTFDKLDDSVGTVYVGPMEPTNKSVKIWVKV